jgi:hypothetical protein
VPVGLVHPAAQKEIRFRRLISGLEMQSFGELRLSTNGRQKLP